jgi:hypothetical protein
MAEGLLSGGANRRAMLGGIDQSLMQFIPPNLRPLMGLLAEANPVVSMERAGTASQGLLSDNATPMQRVGYAGDMLSNMAGVAAPVMVAGRAGLPAAQAIQEGLLGMSQAARLPEFMADESGALRLYQGSPHDFAAERFVRMPDGSTQYIVGRPDVLPDVPTGAEVLRDFPLGRARMDKIGTGEGAQVYGHGLYFAEGEGIAKSYRDALSRGIDGTGMDIRIDGNPIGNPTVDQVRAARFGPEQAADGIKRQIEAAQRRLATASDDDELGIGISDKDMVQMDIDALSKRLGDVQGLAGRIEMAPAGRMYEVNVNANPEDFLDYDAPLSAQPEVARRMGYASPDEIAKMKAEVNQGLAKIAPDGNISALFDNPTPEFERLRRIDSEARSLTDWSNMTGSDVAFRQFQDPVHHAANVKNAVNAGIPGIRYLDAGSRGAGEGSRNYVVFDENLINIVRKYGIAGAATMLGVSQADVAQAMQQPQGLLGPMTPPRAD